jgi:GR25 family glycosyltransferase involved in LPS biosynthesis
MFDDVYFLILNMKKNDDRYENIKKILDSLPSCKYFRIEAIEGLYMEENEDSKRILACREELLGEKFAFKLNSEEWIYDGNIGNSFPGLFRHGNIGAKGLILSNMKAFEHILSLDFSWYCILEDDAELDLEVYSSICKFLQENSHNYDIILLDKRVFGGTAGILYKSSIIEHLYEHLHPLSRFSITLEEKHNTATLWDWKLLKYLEVYQIKFAVLPCIGSGNFISEIS